MIRFKDVTIDDRETIESFTIWGNGQNCDLSFPNIIIWRFLYNTQYAIVDDYLIFRFYAGHHLAYMMPIARPKLCDDGRMRVLPCEECDINVIKAIREDSIAMGHPLLILGVSNYMCDVIDSRLPDMFNVRPERDYADYIYTREKLVRLSGKKLQSKRNHTNKFRSLYPQYEYRPLTSELIPQCIELEKKWRKAQGIPEGTAEELRAMTCAFDNWDRLKLRGGTIWVDGNLVAFTFGAPINHCTFDICVEKADTNYEGAYAIINQEFASHLPEDYYYINREEDMGNEGLRTAKLSYKPDILLVKNSLTEKHPLADFEDTTRIKEETRQLWETVFCEDSKGFVDLYFSRVYHDNINITCQLGGHVTAALQAIPHSILFKGQKCKAAYISGVCTSPDLRRQNIGNSLMAQAHFRLYTLGTVFAALIPAEPWLYEWYGKCGYTENIRCLPAPKDFAYSSFESYDQWQHSHDCILLNDADQFDIACKDYSLDPDHYLSQQEPVQGMIRIINARRALELYASANTEVDMTIQVTGDRHIPANNSYYTIAHGSVATSHEPHPDAQVMTIQQLSSFIFGSQQAVMCLMLN